MCLQKLVLNAAASVVLNVSTVHILGVGLTYAGSPSKKKSSQTPVSVTLPSAPVGGVHSQTTLLHIGSIDPDAGSVTVQVPVACV